MSMAPACLRHCMLALCMLHCALEGAAQERIVVQGVVVGGNNITKERIILRELVFQEGDSLEREVLYQKLERSRQNLMNTSLFNTVSVLPVYLSPGEAIVEVVVNERWYLWPSPIFELADPNFNTWWLTRDLRRLNYGAYVYRYNFRGRNETLFAQMQFGYTRQFGLRYKVPFVDKAQRWGISIGGGYRQQNEITLGTMDNVRILHAAEEGSSRDERVGDIELTLRRAHDVRHFWRLGYTDAELVDTLTADYFTGGASRTRFLKLSYTFVWDRRDLRMFPREGHLAEARVERLGLGIFEEASPDITVLYGSAKKWWLTSERTTVAVSLRGKATFGTPAYYVQEGLGYGQHYVRGYEYYVVDGQHWTLARTNFILQLISPREYRLEPIPLEAFRTLYVALYLNAFVDAGRVWDDLYSDRNALSRDWMGGYGLGLDLVTSYDQVLRGEYSVNILGEHGFFLHFTQPF